MKTLYLMQGIPGSGKSTIAEAICRSVTDSSRRAVIYSTDQLWYENGVYKFDPEQLGAKHAQNQENVRAAMADGISTVIVDNTNITRSAARPYFEMADLYGYQIQVVRVECPYYVAVERQLERPEDRRIQESVIFKMFDSMEDLCG